MADKRMSIVFDASMNIAQVKSAVSEIQKALSGVTMPQNINNAFVKTLDGLTKEIANFEQRASKGLESASDFTALSKSGQKIVSLYDDLQASIRRLGAVSDKELTKLFPPNLVKDIEAANKALNDYNATVKKSQKDIEDQNKAIADQQRNLDELKNKLQAIQSKKAVSPADFKQMKDDLKVAEQELSDYQTKLNETEKAAQEMADKLKAPSKSSKYRALIKEADELRVKMDGARAKVEQLNSAVNNTTTFSKQATDISNLNQSISEAETKLQDMINVLNQLQSKGDTKALDNLRTALQGIQGINLAQFPNTIDGMRQAIASLDAQGLAQLRTGFEQLNGVVQQGTPVIQDFSTRNKEAAVSIEEFNRKSREVDSLKSRIQYFFGITNAINLFRRAITSALNTVKELDAAMTETAVVTDFSVGDMWDKLPKYTETANELGTTTLGAYQTMTLFYQQGLKTNEVFEIGTETMKMARIAGMDYAEATNMMTAALRGFNMELNDTSAQRVNDVYSKLAAITASDTQEISTAMTKTASIANSANMEFETTAAFLSQIIETTRESAETAGTAMKTVIARFQELKKDPAEIQMVDGESVDANKIEGALKTIGVVLRDTNGQFRALDDVFLDIAQRWDGLTTNQQRYIATMAAGSRQQSRFIAMMSDYDRTVQLIEAANNSAGASQAQFEKTTESLESKLNKLKNAWDAYTMGLANSEVIKGAVDLITALITAINRFTDMLPGASGSVAKLGIAMLGLKAGAAVFDTFFLNLKKTGTPIKALGKTFTTVFTNILNSVKKLGRVGTAKFWTFNPKPQIAQMAALQAQYEALEKARTARKASQLGTDHAATIAAIQAERAALIEYKTTLQAAGITQEQYKALKVSGLSVQAQAALLSNNETKAKLLEILTTENLTDAERAEQIAQLAANNQTKLGLLIRLKSYAALLFGTQAKRADAAATLGLASAEAIATGATHGFTAALLACPIGWIAAAIIALIAAVYALWKALEAGNPNKQLEKAQEAAQNAAEAVDSAQESLSNLKTSLDELGDSYSNLEKLTKGTQKWKEAVIATNNQVLDLIKNYKDLAPFVTNQNGVLTLDLGSKEVQSVIDKRQNDLLLAQSASAIANANVEQKQRNADYYNLTGSAKVTQTKYYKSDYNGRQGQTRHEITKAEYDNAMQTRQTNNGTYTTAQVVSRDLTEALAKAIAEGTVRDTGDGIGTSIEDWLRTQDLGTTDITDDQYASMAAGLAENAELLREFGGGLISSIAAEETYRDSIINNAKEYGDISSLTHGDLIGQLDNSMFDDRLDSTIQNEVKAIKGRADKYGNLANQDLEAFADMSDGKYKVSGNKIVDAETGEKVEGLTNDDIARQLAAANATKILSEQIADLNSVFQNISIEAGLEKADELAAMMSANGENISRQMINAYAEGFSTSGEVDWEAFASDYGFEGMEEMAAAFGMTVEDMTALISENFANATNELNKRRTKIVGSVKKANTSTGKSYETIITELKGLEDKFDQVGMDFYGIFDNVQASLGRSENQQVTDLGMRQFWEMANDDSNSAQMIKDLQVFVSGIDWSNPIEAMYSLNQEIANGSGLTQEYASKMKILGNSAYDAGNQMKYMIMSSDFEDVQEDINEIIDANGELAASDVYDLADSYKTLDKFMKNTGVTANGVAKALTMVSKGKIGLNQLTTAVLSAISNFGTLDSVVAKVLKTLDDFDPGADENDIADFINEAYETVNENLEKGAVGNNQIFSYYDLLLGEGWRTKMDEDGNEVALRGDELVAKMREVAEKLRQNSQDMRQSWQDLAAGKDFYGNEAGDLGNLSIVDTGQKIEFTGFEGMTTEDMLTTLQNAYHVSRTYAEMMLGDFKNYSADLAAELNENDYTAAIQAMYNDANYLWQNAQHNDHSNTYTSVKVIDENEIKAAAAVIGRDWEEMKKELESKGALITNFYDEEGMLKSTYDVVSQIKQSLVAGTADDTALWYADFLDNVDETTGVNILDYDRMMDTLARLNIPEEARNRIANGMVNDIQNKLAEGQTVVVDYTLSDGSSTQLTVTPDIDLETAIRNAETQLQNSKLAESIATAFGNAEVSVTMNDESLQAVTETITTEVGGEPYTVSITTDATNMEAVKSSIRSAVEDPNFKPELSVETKTKQITDAIAALNLKKEVTLTYKVSNPEVLNGTTRTVTVPAHAGGIKRAARAHNALIAEEGPELVQTRNGAYIAEKPQIARIEKGDTVFTAEETKKILNTNPVAANQIPRYATGYNADWWYDKNGGGDGTGNNNTINSNNTVNINDDTVEDDPEIWENPYDWLYNLTEKINENLRIRNNLETKFQILQKRGRTSAQITAKYFDEQFRLMEETYDLQEEMFNKRRYEMEKFLNENQDMWKYGYFDMDEMRIVIDWDLIESLDGTENVEEGERIEDYISELERIQELIEDAEAAMLEVALQTEELKDEIRDSYLELEDRVAAALEQIDRNEVEALNQVYDAITSADDDLLAAMREQISEYRQARDNKETEEDIAKKERRLAYMRQDTSGANKVDMLKLEDEIEKARQQYQDKLVDQALTNLQTQQDYAAEQRDKQIALMESQIDWNVKNGVYVAQVAGLLEAAFRDDHFLTEDDALYKVLYDGEGWQSKSVTALGKIIEEINNLAQIALYAQQNNSNGDGQDTSVYNPNTDYMAEMRRAYAAAGGQMTDEVIKLNTFRNQKIADNPELAEQYPQLSVSQAEKQLRDWWETEGKFTFKNTGIGSAGNDFLGQATGNPILGGGGGTNKPSTPTPAPTPPVNQNASYTPSVGSFVRVKSGAVFTNGSGFSERVRQAGVVNGKPGGFKVLKDGGNGNYYIGRDWTKTGVTGLINKKYLTAYAKGGLADFTGPAWLDGTPSKPEVVLNARDTENFFKLRDILRESFDGATSVQSKSGDSYQFDIDINEPKISDDYDVDKLIERVESDIYDKSVYRNVNAVKRLR